MIRAVLFALALVGCSGSVEPSTAAADAGDPCTTEAFPGCYSVPFEAGSPCGTNSFPTELLCCCLPGGDR